MASRKRFDLVQRAAIGLTIAAVIGIALNAQAEQDVKEYPPVTAPTAKGVVVLFDGTKETLAKNWQKRGGGTDAAWNINGGAMIALGGDIVTKEKFTDYQLHVEFKTPLMPNAKGQARGNSGVFMQGRYEIQVLDSFGLESGKGDCGALYNKAAPLVNACRQPREWQTYDISFRAPRFDAEGKLTETGRVTVLQNGIYIHNNTEIPGTTWGESFGKLSEPGPIVLQDHGNAVEYRNIWIMPLPLKGVDRY